MKNEELNMKIAAITEDRRTVSQHFGRAPFYLILTIDNGKIINRFICTKAGHNVFSGQDEPHTDASGKHGYDAASQSRHATMADPISDCQVLLAGGMGMGAYDSLRALGIEVIITDVSDIEDAARLYLEGKLPNLKERLH
jgi:predicted Fe-Mo cluster-binding NifX family protein